MDHSDYEEQQASYSWVDLILLVLSQGRTTPSVIV